MGLVLRYQVSWKLMNVCVAIALVAQGDSGFSLPLSLEASSLIPPVDVEVLRPEPAPAPLLDGPILQAPVISPRYDSAPPLAAETPHEQPYVSTPPPKSDDSRLPLVAKPPEAVSPIPILAPPLAAEAPHTSVVPSPPISQPASPPSSLAPSHGFSLPPLTVPLPLVPLLPLPLLSPAEAPQTSVVPSPPIPQPASPPISTLPSHGFALPPLTVPLPFVPLVPSPLLSPAEAPQTTVMPYLPIPQPASPPISVLPSHGFALPPLTVPLPLVPLVPSPLLSPAEAPQTTVMPYPPIPQPASPPISVLPSHGFALPPLTAPLPFVPLLPSPFLSPAEAPHESSPIPLPVPSHASPSPSSVMIPPPPLYLPPSPSIELPHMSPPPLMMSPLAPPPLDIPSHALYAPPPFQPLYSSVPPSPPMQATVPALPPHASPIKQAPPLPDSPEPSPSWRISPLSSPPVNQSTPESNPPVSHHIEAPKHSAPLIVRSNVSEPHAPPLPAPVPIAAPPSRVSIPVSPPARPMPHRGSHPPKAPSEPKFERLNKTAPPPSHGSHLSPHHYSPVKESPVAAKVHHEMSPAPPPMPRHSSGHSEIAFLSPKYSPTGSSSRHTKGPVAAHVQALPPPPPNLDCAYLTCPEPFTNTPSGSPCGCVWPMQVGLRLSVALYTFFPLVSELAREIASGLLMKQSQVRVMGAKEASQEPEKTIVLVDLVPFNDKFDSNTTFLTFQRFWHKQVQIDKSIFGDYDVLYVHYPGLPPSPPMAPADVAVINSMPYSVQDNNGSKMHPLGVVLPEQRHKDRVNGSLVAVIVFSAIVGVLICFLVAGVLIYRYRDHNLQRALAFQAQNSLGKSSGPTGHSTGSGPSSSLSLGSSLSIYPGSAKTFSPSEIEKATDNYNPSRIVGEGGFGCVYGGTLEDGTCVAVKVLKRDDQQGSREFLAEVKMLSRVHHRNLVKLIGICIDDRTRCLVYELVPNGSVDSHLHGSDRETSPLDWSSRLKIALGAACGLAYLHEDSSPGVIHRDFKSSNILLEDDFTPKVSDFGLARIAVDEENMHISTHIMGTFGYVAPEYAMTGHLLAKSDVYSYGVVLLELLTGRKPVDMSRPPGQENLVAWATPLLTRKEDMESIIDPSIRSSGMSLDSVAKVAAIASMCVQPEVSHRPYMGEVVQALKLISNECHDDDSKDDDSGSCSPNKLSMDFDPLHGQMYLPGSGCDVEKGVISMSMGFDGQKTSSFRRLTASGPIKNTRGSQLWHSLRKLSQGSRSDHGILSLSKFWAASH